MVNANKAPEEPWNVLATVLGTGTKLYPVAIARVVTSAKSAMEHALESQVGKTHGFCSDKIVGNGSCICTGQWGGNTCETAPAESSSTGLSTGALIGIIVGGVAGLAILIGGGVWFAKYRASNTIYKNMNDAGPLLDHEAPSAAKEVKESADTEYF